MNDEKAMTKKNNIARQGRLSSFVIAA